MGLPIYLVDAFAAKRYAGNPAAVVLVTQPLDDGSQQLIAREMNQSETAFVEPVSSIVTMHASSKMIA
jgi:PhzF family phenazine biosynthesis protein